jgi:agmatine deiminase
MKNKFVTIAGIQSAVSSDLKTNLIKTAKQVEKAARMGAKIICLQELYRTHYFPQYPRAKKNKFSETTTGQSVKIFSAIAKKYKVVIIVPIFEKDKRGNYYNSAVVINTEGKLLPTYRKIHIPQDALFYEKNYFKDGNRGYQIYKTRYASFTVLICYDQWFPEAARAAKLAGAEIIFYPTAIGTIQGVKQAEGNWHDAWETVMRGQAIANSLYIMAVNRIGTEKRLKFWGQSFVCNAFGKVIKRAGKNKEAVLIAKINLKDNQILGKEWGFLRNRRVDTYHSLLQNKKSDVP